MLPGGASLLQLWRLGGDLGPVTIFGMRLSLDGGLGRRLAVPVVEMAGLLASSLTRCLSVRCPSGDFEHRHTQTHWDNAPIAEDERGCGFNLMPGLKVAHSVGREVAPSVTFWREEGGQGPSLHRGGIGCEFPP